MSDMQCSCTSYAFTHKFFVPNRMQLNYTHRFVQELISKFDARKLCKFHVHISCTSFLSVCQRHKGEKTLLLTLDC